MKSIPEAPPTVRAEKGAWVFTGKLKPRLLKGGSLLAVKPVYRWHEKCPCRRCSDLFDVLFMRVRCPVCGHQACPRAVDHAQVCTASNETNKQASGS